jgi:hypothetical protein
MRETNEDRMTKTQWKAPHYGVGAGLLFVGLLAGRAFFPLEIPKPFVVEKERRVEVPVDRIVEKQVPFEVVKYVDRLVEKRVEVPVEKIVEKRVEVPVEKIVEKTVMVPVEKIVYRDRVVEKSVPSVPPERSSWRQLSKGLSCEQVRSLLGEPSRISGGDVEFWYYNQNFSSGSLMFIRSRLDSWREP